MDIFLGIALTVSVISNVVIVRLFLKEMQDYKDRFMAKDYREFHELRVDVSKALRERLEEPAEQTEEEEGGNQRLREIARGM